MSRYGEELGGCELDDDERRRGRGGLVVFFLDVPRRELSNGIGIVPNGPAVVELWALQAVVRACRRCGRGV